MRELALRNGGVTFLDDEDYERLYHPTWERRDRRNISYVHRRVYVRGGTRDSQKYLTLILHRLVMNCPDGMVVDHINGDGLDNRKHNLRICTIAQNQKNLRKLKKTACSYRGVVKHGPKFMARIGDGGAVYLGSFSTEIEAALAYDHAAKQMFGEFARLNFPDGVPASHGDNPDSEAFPDARNPFPLTRNRHERTDVVHA
jgi:hypothetical protein